MKYWILVDGHKVKPFNADRLTKAEGLKRISDFVKERGLKSAAGIQIMHERGIYKP